MLGCNQDLSIVIEVQLQLEGGEKALHHRVVPAAALGGHAAGDLVLGEQFAVVVGPVLAALIRVDEQLFWLHPAVAEGPVERLDHQGGIHPLIQLPADNTAAVEVVEQKVIQRTSRCDTARYRQPVLVRM